MKLDLTALQDALAALDRSLAYLHSEISRDSGLREQFRGAAIQSFEVAHETAFKMIRRQLEQMLPDPSAVDQMNYMQVMRSAAEAGLISDPIRFRGYRESRNITSHTYNQSKAEMIASSLDEFAADVRFLLARLEDLNRAGD